MTSYRVFEKLQKVLPDRELPDHGIRMRMANFFFDKPIEESEDEYEKMLEIASIPEVKLTPHIVKCQFLTSVPRFAVSNATPIW